MIIIAEGYKFDFTDAIDVFVFDEKDVAKANFHGVPMKAVDIVVEFDSTYLFVEIKSYPDISVSDINAAVDLLDREKKRAHFNWLKEYLKYKYRDSYLYRYAEDKVDKPIHYICLINYQSAINSRLKKALVIELPVGQKSIRWKRNLVESCQVMNIDVWNARFSKWPVSII